MALTPAQKLWEPRRRIERNYKTALNNLGGQIVRELLPLQDSFQIVSALRRLVASPEFSRYAESMASKMVTSLFSDAGRTWREAARANARGKDIYSALKNEISQGYVWQRIEEQIARNAAIIKTVPLNVASGIVDFIASEAEKGKRAETILEEMRLNFTTDLINNFKTIARTEVSKTQTALTRARSERLNLFWYIWHTEEDSRVRESHELMDGVLVRWSDPPSPEALNGEKSYGKYHAGEIFNCRCFPEPVIDLADITWPHKVYSGGQIQMMTLAQFKNIAA